ncbi:hypothetical protein [Pseudoduganella sp. RAF53_2]|jgi:hypothetical protein|uniref:hypothetical protein n=1 Tax=unclassified Pseudoduganella TaxID=2637179 RepID=UPI003F9C15A9
MRDIYAYRDVAVESFIDHDGQVRVRPLNDQAYSSELRVQCPRALREDYPVGTQFLVSAKLTDRMGGEQYLYVYHGDPFKVLSQQQAGTFLADRRRIRI